MKKGRRFQAAVFALLGLSVLMTAPKIDPLEEAQNIWSWYPPESYPQPVPGDLDIETLSALMNSGNLQWYMPRPEQGIWDSIAALKIHAPPDVVWKVVVDYEAYCEYIPETLTDCSDVTRDGNTVYGNFKAVNSVLNFEYNYDIIDVLNEHPTSHIHLETIDGGLKGRRIDYYFVPIDNNKNTLVFMRQYTHMKSLGVLIRSVLTVIPMIEWPVTASAANYVLNGFKRKAESIVGYTTHPEPATLDYKSLEIETLRKLESYGTGLIRETPRGKTINGLNFMFINASPEMIWEVITDFDNYGKFKDSEVAIEKREKDKVLLTQKMASSSILIFNFGGMEMHNLYTLDPPFHLYYRTIDGEYEGSDGDYYILPTGNKNETILFNSVGLVTERDQSLTMRMVRSGAFPFDTMMCITAARANLASIKREVERRQTSK